MVLKKGGYAWRLASIYTAPPEKTNLCRLFWRIVFNVISLPFVFLFYYSLLGVFSAVMFWFAHRVDTGKDTNELTKPFGKWPAIRGHRLYPVYFLLLALLVYAARFAVPVAQFVMASWLITGIVMAVVVLLALANRVGISEGLKELGKITREYARAKKQKVCPLIEFVE